MKTFFQAHLAWSIILICITFFVDKTWQGVLSYALGTVVIMVNVGLLAFVLKQLFAKKSVALTVFAIVTKYAVLGTIIYLMATQSYLPLVWFVVGLSTVIVSALTYGGVVAIKKVKIA